MNIIKFMIATKYDYQITIFVNETKITYTFYKNRESGKYKFSHVFIYLPTLDKYLKISHSHIDLYKRTNNENYISSIRDHVGMLYRPLLKPIWNSLGTILS